MQLANKWSFALAVVAVLLTLAWYGYSQLGSGAPAHLIVEPGWYDFGRVSVKTETILMLRNTGDKPLEILGISTSCGCTTAWTDQQLILPGAKTPLHISFDPSVHKDLEGTVFRQVYVRSNDPNQPEAAIDFQATIIPLQESP